MTSWQDTDDAPGAAPPEEAQGATEPEPIAAELKRLGTVLAAAVRAASRTPEAESLKSELRAGSQALSREIDEVIAGPREAAARATAEVRSSGREKVRADVASALRTLNRSLENLAASLGPGGEPPAGGAAPDPEATDSGDERPTGG